MSKNYNNDISKNYNNDISKVRLVIGDLLCIVSAENVKTNEFINEK